MRSNIQIVVLILWIVVIFVLTGYPSLKTPKIGEFPIDKLYHFIFFFILGVLEFRILSAYLFFLLGFGVAVTTEVRQLFIPGRDFEILDIAAGVLGLVTIYIIYKLKELQKDDVSKA